MVQDLTHLSLDCAAAAGKLYRSHGGTGTPSTASVARQNPFKLFTREGLLLGCTLPLKLLPTQAGS